MEYGDRICRWLNDPLFHKDKQPLYLQRCTNMAMSQQGVCKNLRDSYRRLVESGLVKYDKDVYLSWSREPYNRKIGHCSMLMKVVSLSRALDDDEVPDQVLDYCLYRGLCHVMMDFDPSGIDYDLYECLVDRFPSRDEAESWLKKLDLHT